MRAHSDGRPLSAAWVSRRAHRATGILAALVHTLALGGCGSSDDSAPPAATPPASEIAPVEAQSVEELRALGYLDFSESLVDADAPAVVLYDPVDSFPGYNLISNRALGSATLFDASGEVVHTWQVEDIEHWANAELLENGDLLVSGGKGAGGVGYLIRLRWDGSERWRARINSHHDAEELSDGRIAALARSKRSIPALSDVKVKDNRIVILDAAGNVLEEASIYDLLNSDRAAFQFQTIDRMLETKLTVLDLLHTNSIEFMRQPESAPPGPLYSPDNVLISIRHQDTVAIVDWKKKQLLWAWGQGEVSGQHDATLLDNGNLLIFDNGLESGHSRVIELDPHRREIVWQYRGEPEGFFTLSRGSSQRLPNGNTLVAVSEAGEAFEVTRDGRMVWRFLNPATNSEGQRATIVRIKRYPLEMVDAFLARAADDEAPPQGS